MQYIKYILLPEILFFAIATGCFQLFQLIVVAKIAIQNKKYRFEVKEISCARIFSIFFALISLNALSFLCFNSNQSQIADIIAIATAVLSFVSFLLPKNILFLNKEIEYGIAAYPLSVPGILDKYIDSQEKMIDKLKSSDQGKFDEIKIYIQRFEHHNDYFQPVELLRIAIDKSKEFDVLLSELEKNIKKAKSIDQAKALKLILSARLPIYQFKEIFSDIQMNIVKRSENTRNQIHLLEIYCECIEQAVTDYIYPKKNKKDLAGKFFLIFNELSSEFLSFHNDTADSNLIESVSSHFYNIFPAIKDFIPSTGSPEEEHFLQYGIDGMNRIETRFFSGKKKNYSDIMYGMIDEIRNRKKLTKKE